MPETEYYPSFLLRSLLCYFCPSICWSICLSIPLFLFPSCPAACLPPSFLPFVCLFVCVYVLFCVSVCMSSCLSICLCFPFLQWQCMLKIACTTFTARCIIFSSIQQSFAVQSEQVLGKKIPVDMSMNLLKMRFIMRKLMNGQRHARHVAINWHMKKCNTK